MTVEKQKKLLIGALFYAVVAVLIYFAARLLFGPLLPFAVAFILAAVLQGVIQRLCDKFKLKREFSAVFLVIGIYAIAGILIGWLIKALYRQLSELVNALPQYSEKIFAAYNYVLDKVNSFFGNIPDIGDGVLSSIPSTALETLAEKAGTALSSFATDFAKAIPSFLLSLAVMVVASTYIAKDYDKITRIFKDNVPNNIIDQFTRIKDGILKRLGKLLRGYLVIMGMTFLELIVGLGLLKVKYALVVAAVTAVVDILPVLGCGTVLVPWAVISALTGSTGRAVGLMILYGVITVLRNVTEPKIIGSKLGVHPVLMLGSVFLGLRMFGGVGVIIAPVTLIILKSVFESRKATSSPTLST